MSLFRAFTSVLPSTSPPAPPSAPPGEGPSTTVVQIEESRQPRKTKTVKPEDKEQPRSDIDRKKSESTDGSGLSGTNGSSFEAIVQEPDSIQGAEQSDLPDDREPDQPIFSTPETIHYNLESETDSDAVASEFRQTSSYITTTTTTQVEERKQADVPRRELFVAQSEAMQHPGQDVSTFSSGTVAGQQLYGVQTSIQGGIQKRTSFYRETSLPPITDAHSNVVETRRAVVQSGAMYNSVQEELKRLKSLYIQQTDCTEAILTRQHQDYERSCQEGFIALQTENENLRHRIAVLEVQLNSFRGRQTTPSLPDNTESTITTITTNITTITTTITTVTTRIDRWKRISATNTGQITLSSKELEQLSLDLSSTTSRLSELQQCYTEQSRDIIAVRNELQATVSLRNEDARTIASLTSEVAQLKHADTMKAEQIAASSSRITELLQRHDTQLSEVTSLRSELQGKVSLIEENNRTIASITAKVDQWKCSDSTKAEKLAAIHQNNEKLQRDLAAVTSQTADLQKRYDSQSNDLVSLRNELQTKGSLLDEKGRNITTLTAELDQWKRTDATTANQFAAARRDNEKLQKDLAAFSSQTADLQKRYDAQSRDLVSIRNELHTKVSLLEEKDHKISSLNIEVAQSRREDSMKVEQIEAARRDAEQLRFDLSVESSRTADLQKRNEALSRELSSVRDELHQIEILYPEGRDQVPGEPSQHAVAQQIAKALETKNKHMDELRRDLASATSRNAELQERHEVLSRELSAVRDELKVETSQNAGTIASLTVQADQWKRADSAKADQIANTLKQVEKLHRDLSTSTTQLAELQSRYEAQSHELITVRTELQGKTSSHERKDRTIASLTAEVDQWKHVDAAKEEQIAGTLKQIESLQKDLSLSASRLAELNGRYEAQSHDLVAVRNELRNMMASHEGKDRTIASLTAEVDQWKRADAVKAEQNASTLQQVETLQRDLSASTSQIAKLQERHDAQSRELISLRNELETKTSLQNGMDHKVIVLAAQVEEWRRADALKQEQIVTTRKLVENLQRDLTNSTSQLAELQQHHEIQSREHRSLREQLEASSSAKDRKVASLTSQVEEWKRSDATKAEELETARRDLEKLRRDLASSSAQIIELQQLAETGSSELTSQIERWKLSDTTKAEELATTRKELDQLRRDLSISSSRIIEFQQRHDAQTMELASLRDQVQAQLSLEGSKDRTVTALTSQIEHWKHADASKAEELTTARKDLAQLQRDLSVASLRIASLEHIPQNPSPTAPPQTEQSSSVSVESREFYEKISTLYEVRDHAAIVRLTATVDEWLHSDARRAEQIALELEKRSKENEELRQKLILLKELYVRAPELKQLFHSQTIEIQRRFEEQSRELKSALAEGQSQLQTVQRFITTADTYADTAIIQMLQKLNAEVQQSTTFMTECVVKDFLPQVAMAKPTKEGTAAIQRVSESIGQTLVGCLVGKGVEEVEFYLPIAFQAYLTYHLRWIVSSWTIEKGRNELINEIYDRLQKSEAQAISGRWRSLTRNYILPTCMSASSTLIASTMAGMSDIVMVAGCAASQSAAKTKISSKFESKISSIISIAGRFSKMIGEVVSGDFEVFATRPGETFEEETMEDDMDDEDKGQAMPGGTGTGQKVLCSTHLGMTKRMQLESGKKETLTVVKGKVVLESFLDI